MRNALRLSALASFLTAQPGLAASGEPVPSDPSILPSAPTLLVITDDASLVEEQHRSLNAQRVPFAARNQLIGALRAARFFIAAGLPHASGLAKPDRTAPPAKADDGTSLYQAKCSGCHSIAASKIGPAHRRVFGRRAAMVPGYKYSPKLRAADIKWNGRTLDQWLQAPQKLDKYLAARDRQQRAAIIAYLPSDAAK